MLEILKRQRDRNGIGRDMKDVTIASKSGALDHLRSDVGIIYSKRWPNRYGDHDRQHPRRELDFG